MPTLDPEQQIHLTAAAQPPPGLLRTAGAIAIAPRPVEVPPLFGKWSASHAKLAKEKHVTFSGTEIPAQPLIRDKIATAIKTVIVLAICGNHKI